MSVAGSQYRQVLFFGLGIYSLLPPLLRAAVTHFHISNKLVIHRSFPEKFLFVLSTKRGKRLFCFEKKKLSTSRASGREFVVYFIFLSLLSWQVTKQYEYESFVTNYFLILVDNRRFNYHQRRFSWRPSPLSEWISKFSIVLSQYLFTFSRYLNGNVRVEVQCSWKR